MSPARADRPIPWRSRPLLVAAALLAGGIATATEFGDVDARAWSVLLSVATACALGAMIMPRRGLVTLRSLAVTGFVSLALFALGGQRRALWLESAGGPLAALAAEADGADHVFPMMVSGRVRGSISETDRNLRFRLSVDSIGYEALIPVQGLADVTVWKPRPGEAAPDAAAWPALRPGDRVTVEGHLRPLPQRRNPADFDFGAYLRRRGVEAIVAASGSGIITVTGHNPSLPDRFLANSRSHVRSALDRHVRDASARAVLQALLLADRSSIDPEVRRGFARTGLAHLLAVSGLHVFLVGMVLYGLLKPVLHRFGWAWRNVEMVRSVATITVLGCYVAVVGAPPSAMRALVMAAAFIAGRAFERPASALNSLGGAALVLLTLRPAALADVGFQLSFSAVAALILLIPHLEKLTPDVLLSGQISGYMTRLLLASIAATLGTMPALLAHFGVVPLAGVVLNLVAIPATALGLGAGLLTVAFHGWLSPLATAAGASAEMLIRLVLTTGLHGERWLGWSTVGAHVTSSFLLTSLSIGVLTLAFLARPRIRWRLCAAALLCVALAVWISVLAGNHRERLELLFFDVGQGDAVLVMLPGGQNLLVDAGPRDPYGDAGSRTLIPHMERFRIRSIDAVIVSHPHADHLGGVPALLESVRVGVLYDNGETFDSDLYRETIAGAEIAGVPVASLGAGDEIAIDPNVQIRVLHPGPEPDAHTNDASVVLHLSYGQVTVLLTEDVEKEAERRLAARYGPALCADVVKVPHHGSRTSSSADLVDAATRCGRSTRAIVQVARRNRYHLPNEEALDRWRTAGASVSLTATDGAVWLRTDGRSVESRTWR